VDAGSVRRVSATTKMQLADGEIVWSWRPDAGAKFSRKRFRESDGGKRARSPRRARISRKTIAWGMPDVSGTSAVNTRVHTPTTKRTRGCGCIGHPAFPAPSYFRGWFALQPGRSERRGIAKSHLSRCLIFEIE
jgi:hypothetical protein